MKHSFLLFAALLVSIAMSAGSVTLTSAQIKAGTGSSSYGNCSAVDDAGNTWTAYAIKTQHSNATADYHHWQIKKSDSSTSSYYYIAVPSMPGNIQSISLIVSSSSKPMDGGGNTATYFFSNDKTTSAAGTGVVSGTGSSNVTLDVSALKLTTGYITVGSATRIWGITVTYEGNASFPVLQSIYISGTPEKLNYTEGDSFETDGLKVMGKYDKGDDKPLSSNVTWTCNPEILTLGITSVTVKAKYDTITSPDFVVNGLTVKQYVKTYANTYTSNVAFSTEGGTSAKIEKVVIKRDTFETIKAGTSSNAGKCVITIPSNTKTLHFHAAGWSKENVTISVNGTSYPLTADAGITGNSPYKLQNDPETTDYFTFNPKGATTITIEATSGKRFVIFGVNTESQSTGTNLNTVETSNMVRKAFINNQIVIIKDDHIYTLHGAAL